MHSILFIVYFVHGRRGRDTCWRCLKGRRPGKGIDCHLGLTRMSLEHDALAILRNISIISRLHLSTRAICGMFTCPLQSLPRWVLPLEHVASRERDQMKLKQIMCSKKIRRPKPNRRYVLTAIKMRSKLQSEPRARENPGPL